ncbi:hypothetical protein C1645_744898 [Glomus cerebriforme]|uniref:Uncharacterized protein n=1 Tax=Glomus cerebriforme TaxID=658196 RepID=A0A397S4J0_9GLOM|nr:hypothetical protein C1645_744898 [Glomus cerebriforme]
MLTKKDERIGIFDTKEGQTVVSNDTKLKAEALQRYIKENRSEKPAFTIKVIDAPDIQIFLETFDKETSSIKRTPFIGIEMVEAHSPKYENGGSVMRDIYNKIEKEE